MGRFSFLSFVQTASSAKGNEKAKVLLRHQPTYKNFEVFCEPTKSINCTEFEQKHVRKQVVTHKEYRYVHYFATNDDDIEIPSEGSLQKKRIDKRSAEHLKKIVLPYRSITEAAAFAKSTGYHPTKKQLRNLARSSITTRVGKEGPRCHTSLAMVKQIEQVHPDQIFYKHDGNTLTDLNFFYISDEACSIFMSACPDKDEHTDWIATVDSLIAADPLTRKAEIKKILKKNPTGVMMPSRIHIDTTFNLGDCYVTIALGETKNFKTKASLKERVIPIGFLIHSSKARESHERFSTALRTALFKHNNPLHPKQIPCVLLDGEEALETYGEALDAPVIRCDLHILSLLSFDYGGKAAANLAKPFLFGRKVQGVWKTGVFGVFHLQDFEKRLEKVKGKIHPKIFDWIVLNKRMLMDNSSAAAKLKAGHLLQYSTNNQNETFNKLVKVKLTKRYPTPKLIDLLQTFFEDKMKECRLAALNSSDDVVMTVDVRKFSYSEKWSHFYDIGLSTPMILALGVPAFLAMHIDQERSAEEEKRVGSLVLEFQGTDVYRLEDVLIPKTNRQGRWISVSVNEDSIDCWSCQHTLPSYVCCHVLTVYADTDTTTANQSSSAGNVSSPAANHSSLAATSPITSELTFSSVSSSDMTARRSSRRRNPRRLYSPDLSITSLNSTVY
ncbi:hypothetical protein GCK72_012086 [Caenorhabditis remanei]|uniref:SWIM-type domain-containing protein n=1 Tax=Caenorhabditis remanei TaxID=31234 RepID=A0A6A5GLX4_CAERE|nr:hypothetical protein GCK72_012086 [Caenorhabditis remanei]KAF1755636.1 hypothetical protein GCK72_012086 [Caenorhabditis remanei]